MQALSSLKLNRDAHYRISTTPTADFLLAPHPRIAGIHLATGGSAHAWKFLPIIGDLVVNSIEGVLSPELVKKWSYERGTDGGDDNAPRMDGKPEELRDVVRSRL
jgi:sarcosine oxidase/L-pipecolate oxidase